MRILVAEDDPFSRRFLVKTLEGWGYEVHAVCDGEKALEVLQGDDSPRLVLLDWMMPGLDGLELCRRIRQTDAGRPIYVIMLTAKGEVEDLVQAMDAGADDYTTKSFDVRELKVRLRAGERILTLEESLHRMATRDALTGLWNRAAIRGILDKELGRSRRKGTSIGVIMCDVDHFKRVNDLHGHASGDAVLVEVARRLTCGLRTYDSIGRYGGEEFLIVLPEASLVQTIEVGERLRARVAADPVQVANECIAVRASFGAAIYQAEQAGNADGIIKMADAALYQAKDAGRNRVETSSGSASAVQSAV